MCGTKGAVQVKAHMTFLGLRLFEMFKHIDAKLQNCYSKLTFTKFFV
jgi:hypothetical protein